jgi:hypothetical protein
MNGKHETQLLRVGFVCKINAGGLPSAPAALAAAPPLLGQPRYGCCTMMTNTPLNVQVVLKFAFGASNAPIWCPRRGAMCKILSMSSGVT